MCGAIKCPRMGLYQGTTFSRADCNLETLGLQPGTTNLCQLSARLNCL